MKTGFLNVRFHVNGKEDDELSLVGIRSLPHRGIGRPEVDGTERGFNNDEAAARFYLRRLFDRDPRGAVRAVGGTSGTRSASELRLLGMDDSPLTRTKLVRFDQTRGSIPIFGSSALVELDENRELVSVSADVAEIGGVSAVASLSPRQALEKIIQMTGASIMILNDQRAPHLTFFRDDSGIWHLAYFFVGMPAAPAGFMQSASDRKSRGHGPGQSPRGRHPVLNYLVDAHNGEILLYYSATPMLASPSMPSKCKGIDEEDTLQEFLGGKVQAGFEMNDPFRAIKTYDLQFSDLEKVPLPALPVQSTDNDWDDINKAAVSAHVNAMRVYNFYNSVLMRKGIDDRGMDLVSVVNCTLGEEAPEWRNAVWWNNRMWYGQENGVSGTFRSFSRFLDVIAHELTHGVTENTANLVYLEESGALNESFSDIFGIIIKNWYTVGADSDVGGWNWDMGVGLGSDGLPLRDFSNPKRTGDPDHMNDYLQTQYDNGGVHTNSNIHNKAAYNVLTARNPQGQTIFTSREVAILYYLCLTRLSSVATFSKTLQVLLDVATTYFAGESDLQIKIDCIKQAYKKVGIV